ncbi:hypothetical protein [uncultured Campylobacter sp.]|uniref:hypothetical protein n=1 Tax=uncultured Campylobacter sp. TaxID=218934 RepID=UPI00260D111C|nr:hypothetical protein [uncultured Campylobacter sp.]
MAIKAAPRNFKFSPFAQVFAAKFALRFKFTFCVAAFNLALQAAQNFKIYVRASKTAAFEKQI